LATKETREVLDFALSLARGLGLSLEDGSVSLGDVLNFMEAFQRANAALDNVAGVLPELQSMTDADRQALVKAVDQLDLPNDQIELIVEKALKAGLLIAELAVTFIPKKKAS
jgi:hypothetical protein